MADHTVRIAVFPGSFDPVTNGHLDVIRRGRVLFDELIVAVGQNPDKRTLFTQAERVEMVRELLADDEGVRVEPYDGLTVDFAGRVGAAAILRGIRNSSDLQSELQMALTNRTLSGVETVFVMTGAEYVFVSSRLIKQIAAAGRDVSSFVPPSVAARMRAKGRGADGRPVEDAG